MRGGSSSKWLFRLFAGVTLFASSTPAMPQPLERSVKAAFLTKFPRYVEWPAGAPAAARPMELCIVGTDPFGGVIDQAARSDPTPLIVRRVERAEQARGCAIAFLAGSRQQPISAMIAALQNQPVLTITDSRSGPAKGIIHFAVRQGKVGFHIDDALAARSRLSISSRLLQLALSVRQRTG